MTKRLIALDPLTGTACYVDYNEADDSFTIVNEVDPRQIIERNKRLYNDAPARFGDLADISSMPELLRWQLVQEGIWDDPKARARWLNDSDNRAWRTRPGRV